MVLEANNESSSQAVTQSNSVVLLQTIGHRCSPGMLVLYVPLEPIPPAPIASLEPALPTFKDILRETMVAFLTSVRTANIFPSVMRAFVVFSELLDCLGNPNISLRLCMGNGSFLNEYGSFYCCCWSRFFLFGLICFW